MKISDMQKETLNKQRSIMRQITNRRMKIATGLPTAEHGRLLGQISSLQEALVNATDDMAAVRDMFRFQTETGVFSSEHVIPLPTVAVEKIRVGAAGVTSSFDAEG